MKIALINGSPKVKESASESVLKAIKDLLLQENVVVSEYHFSKSQLDIENIEQFMDNECFVFAFPLYVDGIPSHLLHCLLQLETLAKARPQKEIYVYALVNCGFYEGHQNALAIEMMKNWTVKAGLIWGQGIGVGAGGMLTMLKSVPLGQGPMKSLGKALTQFIDTIVNKASQDSIYVTANFPRLLYKFGGEMGWRKSAKVNGLKRKDLFRRT